jgi:hypothetical protein
MGIPHVNFGDVAVGSSKEIDFTVTISISSGSVMGPVMSSLPE